MATLMLSTLAPGQSQNDQGQNQDNQGQNQNDQGQNQNNQGQNPLSTAGQSATAVNVVQLTPVDRSEATQSLSSSAVSDWWIGTGNGWISAWCVDRRIHSTSKVVASVCELTSTADPGSTHLGACVMTVHNVVPSDGGVWVLLEIAWKNPLPYRIQAIIDT
jgi:hypothetical protein